VSAVSQSQVALATLALGGASVTNPGTPEITMPATAAWNRIVEGAWPELQAKFNPKLEDAIRAQVGTLGQGGVVRVLGIRNLALDTNAPAGLEGRTLGPALQLEAVAPIAPGAVWAISFTADVGTTITTSVLGIPIQVTLAIDVTVEVADVRIRASANFDATNPARPLVASSGVPQVDMTLRLRSGDPLFGQVVGPLNQVLDPVIRVALVGGGIYARQQIAGMLPQLNVVPYGTGGPGTQGVAGVDLALEAEKVGDEILKNHIPFGTLVTTEFDSPVFGQGNVVTYGGYGDSAIWTGHYLMAEALRYDLTGDARALDGATRATGGFDVCIGLTGRSGLLSRMCIPEWSPEFARHGGGFDWGTGYTNGVLYGGFNDISRDQYLGAFMGLLTAYQRVPQLRPLAQKNVTEMVQFLEASNWNVYRVREPLVWARFSPGVQTPGVVYAFTSAGRAVDPVANGAIGAKYQDLASLVWLGTWGSSREVNEGYYKFNLGHDEHAILFSSEADPTRYRDVVKSIEVMRDAVGHHENAWFDSVYGMAVPARAQSMGVRVKAQLEQWVQRPRRGFTIRNSQDPTIAKVLYSSPLQVSTPPSWASVIPIPIEKRPYGDFVWQTHAFQLDGHGDPHEQHPGADLVQPYWTARSFGLLP